LADKETTYKIEMDTSEAQQKVEELDGKTKSLRERVEDVGSAGRSIGDGIAGGVGQGMGSLNSLGGALGSAESAASALGSAGAAAGGWMRSAFENAADASDSMGSSFTKNYTKAKEAGKGFGESIRTGVVGAVDTAKKKVSGFVKDTVAGAKKIGDSFLHPIQTIKSKFTGGMKDASKSVDQVGDEANRTEKDLDKMGNSGEGAGSKIKSGLGGALKVLAAVAAVAVAVTGIAKFVTAAMDASKAAENISHSFNQTFGDNAPDVESWADNFSKAVHRSGTEVKSFLTSNRQLYESMGITGEAASDLSKMTTSLAYDLGNFAGIDDVEALSKLQDAIGGNAAALSDFGVRLDDATLKQTAMGMGLGGNLDAMDEAALAQVRFNSILEQTGDLQGNASKSLGGLTGGMKAVKAVYTDFLEKAGAKLAPTFDKLFGVVLDAWPKVEPALMSFADLLANGFEQAAPILGDFATTLLPQVLGLAGEFLPILGNIGGQLLPVLSQVLGTVAQAVQPLLPLISTLAKTLLPPLAQLFGMLVEKLLPPAAQLLGALSPVIDALSPVLQVAASGIGLVADAISGLIGWLTKGIEKVSEFAQKIKDSPVGQFAGGIGEKISSIGNKVFGGNAKGTDNFEGGWTRIHEAGGELIHNKDESGVAFLPKGSAVIPASKTDEILSSSESSGGKIINITNLLPAAMQNAGNDEKKTPLERAASKLEQILPQPIRDWIPTVVEGNPLLNKATTPTNEPDRDDPPKKPDDGGTGGGGHPPPPAPDPGPTPEAAGGETVTRRIIELRVTVSSPDGTVPPEVLEQFREIAKDAAREAYQEEQDAEINNLAIQNGYAG